MVQESESLQIAAIFVLFIASFIGISLPFAIPAAYTKAIIPFVNALAAGVMVGLALIHLMPESNEMLTDLYEDYPISNALVGFGIIFTLTIEQLVFITFQPHSILVDTKSGKEGSDCSLELGVVSSLPEAGEGSDDSKKDTSDKNYQKALVHTHDHSHHDHDHDHDHDGHHDHDHAAVALNALTSAISLKDLITAYALEISTGIHSIVIGFDLGVLTNADLSTIRILFAVLVFHQFAEGLGLGSVIKTSEKQLGSAKIITFISVFSCTVSIGVILGLSIKPDDESDLQKGLEGSVTSIAAGSMLYIALVELVGIYFNLPELEKEGWKKIGMLGLFFLGAAVLGIIGIWAQATQILSTLLILPNLLQLFRN